MAERMTEEEAGTRVCPPRSAYEDKNCIGDKCAWWQWWVKNPSVVKDDSGAPMPRERWTGSCGHLIRSGG